MGLAAQSTRSRRAIWNHRISLWEPGPALLGPR